MSVDSTVSGLLRQIATQDVVEVRDEMGGLRRVAARAAVVEQYGFEYGGAWREGHNKSTLVACLYRDTRPEARAREAATIAAFPQAGRGGPVPGMRPGTLKPLPEAEQTVAHLKDRIAFDVTAEAAGPKQKRFVWAITAGLVLTLLIAGYYLGALVGGALLSGFLLFAFRIGDVRRRKITERLTAAGFAAVRDEHGRQRFLRPGQQLPGHANPFAN
ncbi:MULTISPECIES: hypothetical protein [Streptomyces]|uniref:Integral membrane protein n=1 Tax=Streptomyces solicathayae TaxID=3081768 RepID=A0ABZ0LWY9_9ACTN|nr:hypothetical protein [Streptomyces sp. HUAS YS2]WOX24023.1 hypothetical protein R2D22_22595 [Streptomyces sp. HUAS YS2]